MTALSFHPNGLGFDFQLQEIPMKKLLVAAVIAIMSFSSVAVE